MSKYRKIQWSYKPWDIYQLDHMLRGTVGLSACSEIESSSFFFFFFVPESSVSRAWLPAMDDDDQEEFSIFFLNSPTNHSCMGTEPLVVSMISCGFPDFQRLYSSSSWMDFHKTSIKNFWTSFLIGGVSQTRLRRRRALFVNMAHI